MHGAVKKRPTPWRHIQLSLFEKVILLNSLMLICEAFAGFWITSHHLESQHYLIDTGFIVLATILSLTVNFVLLRASFKPLFSLLNTMHTVSAGNHQARVSISSSDHEINELARTFNGMLDHLESLRKEQGLLIFRAQEDERRRLGLELHDESGQNLTALLIHAEVLNQHLQALPDTQATRETHKHLQEGLHQLTLLTQQTLENIRTIAQQLRPGVLDDLGLYAAFRWLAEDARQRFKLETELIISPTQAPKLPADFETALFRITQESLTNIARHANATHANICLRCEAGEVQLFVQDNGRGYNPNNSHRGFGIISMHERAALLGGQTNIQSRPNEGTTIKVCLPLPEAEQKKETLYV
ncbi:MAG TPA: ATP-binding protein [Ktedonobacteraceae bacterium]|nr:ATP-binding protein [Ktedonobacteraceae bacterium]